MLQITKLRKNHKKIPQRQSWANCWQHADIFLALHRISVPSGKIADLRTRVMGVWVRVGGGGGGVEGVGVGGL